jgi:hypothetical protein
VSRWEDSSIAMGGRQSREKKLDNTKVDSNNGASPVFQQSEEATRSTVAVEIQENLVVQNSNSTSNFTSGASPSNNVQYNHQAPIEATSTDIYCCIDVMRSDNGVLTYTSRGY